MSAKNAETHRRAHELFNRRDFDGALREMHPDAELDWSRSHGLRSGIYRGKADEFLARPERVSDPGIFQFDIWRSVVGEYFRIWPGARDNRFTVLDADPKFRQVVLAVQEPRRRWSSAPARGTPAR
jgi:hypothetical protein